MTLPASGQIAMSDLNGEFGRASSTLQLTFSQSFAGVYAQYGAINRNTAAGQNIFAANLGGTDFTLSTFYSYNDLENNYWDYLFDNQSPYDCDIKINIGGTNIYTNTLINGSTDSSGKYVDTTTTAGTGTNLDIYLRPSGGSINFVDISVTDPDTGATIYSATGADPNTGYPRWTTLATLYGYQRMQFNITLYM